MLFSFVHNVARTFELIINGGRLLQTGEPAIDHAKTLADYDSFEELYTDFEKEPFRQLSLRMRRIDIYLDCYAELRPSFLLSSMIHDCLERGRSMNAGGARYRDYGGSGVGIPNVGDSLFALKRLIFDEQRYAGDEILNALRADFVGYEKMQNQMLRAPKYGWDEPEVDAMTDRVLLSFIAPLNAHRNRYGGHAKPVILGFTRVVGMGLETGATPDGRKSEQPLAHGLSPQRGATSKGTLSAINSATRLSLRKVGGGAGMMWDFDTELARPDVMKPVLQTFVDKGGHIFQGNTVSVSTLLTAQKNPEQFTHLMVREVRDALSGNTTRDYRKEPLWQLTPSISG